jgi:hypothetical protein
VARWATLKGEGELRGKLEERSVLATSDAWESSNEPLTDEDAGVADHNPTPSML